MSQATLIGQRIGQYEIIALLGKGGMSEVYRARQINLSREVALKLIHSGSVQDSGAEENARLMLKRFRLEAETIARLSHPHIVPIFDYGEHEGHPYQVIQLMRAGSLADRIEAGKLPVDDVLRLTQQIASALDYAHRQQVLHRDLKPANVFMDESGNAILGDFGLAKWTNQSMGLTKTGFILGTPVYLAPEQWLDEPLDNGIDIYALGIIVFEMLAGKRPFTGSIHALMDAHINAPVPLLRDFGTECPYAVQSVLEKAMAKNRADRFATAGELSAALQAAFNPPNGQSLSTLRGAPSRAVRVATKPRSDGVLADDLPIVPGYELVERIGQGGFGAVYRAYQPIVNREVAVKLILPQHANDPDFIRRFEQEAQTIAGLEHPFIVPLYDYWREPDAAYLVMRLVRGGNLRSKLLASMLNRPLIVRVLTQIVDALALVHRNGVIHRDLKPENILLDQDDNAYLTDFGIAMQLSPIDSNRDQHMAGSLLYMAPEQIKGETLSPRTDIYALAIIIYELLLGKHPYWQVAPSAIMYKQLYEEFPDLSSLVGLPTSLDSVLKRALSKQAEDRQSSAYELLEDVLDALREPDSVTNQTIKRVRVNPFKGLQPFSLADARYFFGRESLVQHMLTHLNETGDYSRFLAVIGPSGSGKSSVVSAGLLPALRNNAIQGSGKWFMVECRPGSAPLVSLAAALNSVAQRPSSRMLEQLHSDKMALVWAADRVLADVEGELVLVIHQFEEVFTLVRDAALRAHFLALLTAAISEPDSRLRVIVTLRADMMDAALRDADFGRVMSQRIAFVLPMNLEEIERCIVQPAKAVGLEVEPELLVAMVAEVRSEPGSLPLLQFLLDALYRECVGVQRLDRLTLPAYQKLGRLTGALAAHAESVFAGLTPDQQVLVQRVLLRVVTIDGQSVAARPAERADLLAMGDVEPLLEAFGEARLLTFDVEPEGRRPIVQLAHEALIRSWKRLDSWIQDNREALHMQRGLAAAAAEWQRAGRDASYLLSGARLSSNRVLESNGVVVLTAAEREYLRASLAEQERIDAERQAAAVRVAESASRARRLALTFRLFFALLGGIVAVGAMTFASYIPDALVFGPDRVGLTTGQGVPFGLLLALLVLCSGELPELIRAVPLRWAVRITAAVGIGALAWAAYTWLALQYAPDWGVMIFAGVSLGLGFALSSVRWMPGTMRVLLTAISVFVPILALNHIFWIGELPLLPFRAGEMALLYFEDETQVWQLGLLFALSVAIGLHAQAAWRDLRTLATRMMQRFRGE